MDALSVVGMSTVAGPVGVASMDSATQIWWALLCAVALINVSAWAVSAFVVRHRERRAALLRAQGRSVPARSVPALGALAAADWPARTLLLLSAGYVFGCAYRSVLPVYDIQRLCLIDGPWSSVLVGRTVATVAELCFAAQWAVALRHVAQRCGSGLALKVSGLIVPMIVIAEICSWTAVLTTSNLGHVIEESLWGAAATLLALSLLSPRIRATCTDELRAVVRVCTVAAIVYAAYMFFVDVPMYWARFVADEAVSRPYFTLAEGFVDAATRWTAIGSWSHWRTEVVWMSLYFSAAVWLSIALVHAPQWPRLSKGTPRRRLARAATV